jgi:hypothetical protein
MNAHISPQYRGLDAASSPARLQAALRIGTSPDAADLDALIARCAVEPDFFVRDMLTWALTRLPADAVLPRLVVEVERGAPQARSQALHTLSKIADVSTYPTAVAAIADRDDEVARAAWRAAVATVPADGTWALGELLAGQLERGDRGLQLSLSQAIVALGEAVVVPLLEPRIDEPHAAETLRLLEDPHAGSQLAVETARREVAKGNTRSAKG